MRGAALAFIGSLLMVVCAAPLPALAQAAGEGDRTSYPASHYQQYSPQTALDMVRRTPGFVLDEGDSDLRGFGATAGNALINGLRPSAKGGIVDALRRIPASQVERIELIRGASATEAQGQTLILNVVQKPGASAGTWTLELERNANGVIYPEVDLSYSRSIGGWQTSARLNGYWEEFPIRALRLNRDAAGVLVSSIVTDLPSTLSEIYASGDAKRPVAGGLLTLNARVGHYDYHYDQPGEIFLGRLPDGAPDQRQMTVLEVHRWIFEGGADYTRSFDDWTWRTVLVGNYRDGGETSSDLRETTSGDLISRSVVESTAKPLEIVGRTTFAGVGERRLRPEFGGEIAYNRFDRTFSLAVDNGSGLTPVPIPAADITVEELRGEVFANLFWTMSPNWSVEGGLAAEASSISVSGDADQSQSFRFFKPSFALVWKPTDRLQIRAGVRRTVGQLDFNDFAANAELDDGTTVAGNPNLGPDQTTRWYLSADFRGTGDFAVNIEAFREDRTDIIEQVLLPSGAPGLANAGDATFQGVRASFTLPLDRALPGGRITAEGQALDSAFYDPLIARTRPLSSVWTPDIDLEFRHDPPGKPYAWGVNWRVADEGETYFVDEIAVGRTGGFMTAFAETTAWKGLKVRLDLRNTGTQRRYRFRSFYAPDRSGVLERTEERFTRLPMFVTLTISGTF